MNQFLRNYRFAPVLVAAAAIPSAYGFGIDATFTDLANGPGPGDLWSVSYELVSATFLADTGFTVYFEPAHYEGLSFVGSGPADWDVLVIQPDLGFALPGFLDALALQDNPPVVDPFVLEFIWLGPGRPGSQPFEVYSLVNGFEILEQGQTRVTPNTVPEGSAGVAVPVVLTAWGAAWLRRRRSGLGTAA